MILATKIKLDLQFDQQIVQIQQMYLHILPIQHIDLQVVLVQQINLQIVLVQQFDLQIAKIDRHFDLQTAQSCIRLRVRVRGHWYLKMHEI